LETLVLDAFDKVVQQIEEHSGPHVDEIVAVLLPSFLFVRFVDWRRYLRRFAHTDLNAEPTVG
jgi:hypothetical protein